jgi:fatty-acyl-CoA synthase
VFGDDGLSPPDHLAPLTPLSYLARSRLVYGDRIGVSDGGREFTYSELFDRSARLAGFLRQAGVAGDRVAFLSPNTHVLLEGHFGVAAAGAVLVAMNARLSPDELGQIIAHSGSTVLVVDHTLRAEASEAVRRSERPVLVIEAGDEGSEYEERLGAAEPMWSEPASEHAMLSINYTSGTTGEPKGVVYHHRGAFLQALAMAYHARLDLDSVYLWTLPMFHTNGWCFPWAVTAAGSRHLLFPRIDPAEIWRMIRTEGVTHMCAAPTVLLLMAAHESAGAGAPRQVRVMTGGAPPTPALLERMAALNLDVVHLYGLTETVGPAAICDWRPEWDLLPADQQARLKARQGVGNVISRAVRVVDADGLDVPPDAETVGEIAVSGNNVMTGYFKDDDGTARAIPDGWFRTGDLAVMHPDGYVEIVDRKKDIIISGGENISSVEVERVLASHPSVFEAAVVAAHDEKWGEVPVAFVELHAGHEIPAEDLVAYVRSQIAHYKAPRRIIYQPLPRTSTGKIQKHLLRREEK